MNKEQIEAQIEALEWAMHPDRHFDLGQTVTENFRGRIAVLREQVADDQTPKEILASRLIDAWCEAHGRPVSWAKAVQITAIITKISWLEKRRLLKLGDQS